MRIHFKLTRRLHNQILDDLGRPHAFAAERVGFISCRPASTPTGLVLLAASYEPVADEHYLPDESVGAMMGPDASRTALRFSYNHHVSMFHVHLHDHTGVPGFSKTDVRETANFIPDFFHVQPSLPHGAIILSRDSAAGRCWIARSQSPVRISKITFVGTPLSFIETSCSQPD
jgi:hypothetical protein